MYPVASLNNGATILCIHQHSPTDIELLEWNINTNQMDPILWSVFNPAGLQMLPDNSGFSFIDNGRLRIKLFQRRSPKAIDFDEPLFGINGLQWIDNHTCYCSAYYNDNFALFELHDDGTMKCLHRKKGSDYLYPQKIDEQLFYIERSATKTTVNYRIMQCAYQNGSATIIADFCDVPIVFLTMVSDKHGFVLEHAQSIDSNSSTMSFSYHEIKKQGDIWHKKILFSFSIPTNLLNFPSVHPEPVEGLYESLLPLLPRIIDGKVYFVDCAKNHNQNLEPYFYDLSADLSDEVLTKSEALRQSSEALCERGAKEDLSTKKVQKISLPIKNGHYFVPMQCGNSFYCGGIILNDRKPLASFLT